MFYIVTSVNKKWYLVIVILFVALFYIYNNYGILWDIIPISAILAFDKLLIYFFIIPLLNVVADLISIIITRWTMRRGARDVGINSLYFIAVDFLSSVLLFSVYMSLIVVFLRFSGEVMLNAELDASIMIRELTSFNPKYIWVYACMLTIFVPSLIHMLVSIWAFGPALIGKKYRFILARLSQKSKSDYIVRIIVTNVISIWITLSIVFPVTVSYFVVSFVNFELPPKVGEILGFLLKV